MVMLSWQWGCSSPTVTAPDWQQGTRKTGNMFYLPWARNRFLEADFHHQGCSTLYSRRPSRRHPRHDQAWWPSPAGELQWIHPLLQEPLWPLLRLGGGQGSAEQCTEYNSSAVRLDWCPTWQFQSNGCSTRPADMRADSRINYVTSVSKHAYPPPSVWGTQEPRPAASEAGPAAIVQFRLAEASADST